MPTIFPSLLGASPLNLQKEIELLEPHCQGFHLDIMDDHFVPNLTWGQDTVNAITKITRRTLWAHLMVQTPETWIDRLLLPPGSIVSFHIESIKKNIHLAKRIREKKWIASVAVSPKTSVKEIFSLIGEIVDHVLIMSVEPGFAGQKFNPGVIDKVKDLVGYRQTSGLTFTIGMDGGINKNNIKMLADIGVDHFAIAGGIFSHADRIGALKELQVLVGE